MPTLNTLRRLLLLAPALLLAGCNTVLMNPSGDIAAQQGKLIVASTWLMLLIIVPVIAPDDLLRLALPRLQRRSHATSPTGTTPPSSSW